MSTTKQLSGMKLRVLTITAATLLVLLVLWLAFFAQSHPPNAEKFSVGMPLPAGKVTPQLVNTWDAAILLAPDGSLWIWGGSQFQLNSMVSKRVITPIPFRLVPGNDWRNVAGGYGHVLALKGDGSLWAWGDNRSGAVGQPPTSNSAAPITRPTRVGTETDWVRIASGLGHNLALKKEGTLWAWGQNNAGQVGDGTISNKFAPTQITTDHDWKTIAAGAFNSFALKQDGTLWGWGVDPISGGSKNDLTPTQIGADTNWQSLSSGDFCLLALKSDGTVWLHGQNAHITASDYAHASVADFVQIGQDKDWNEIYAGQSDFFARKNDGSWWTCGANYSGELGLGRSGPSGFPVRLSFRFEPWAFAPGYANTLLLARDGKLWTWGKRLGYSRSINSMEKFVNNIARVLPGHRTFFNPRIDKNDPVPFKVWELPADVRNSLQPVSTQ
jgi:alpha-tubulin suppressor-like RCC1 family protein